MKRKVFDLGLYKEGLRQSSLFFIVYSVLTGLVAVAIPLLGFLASIGKKDDAVETVNYITMNPLIFLSFCVFAPVLVLGMFRFLNKRESSDFYHAIPATRLCLFVSFFTAILTLLLVYIAGIGAVSSLLYSFFPKLFSVNWTSVLSISFNCFAACVLIASSVAIAMTVSGTLFTGILLSLLIIFLPRILLLFLLTGIEGAFPLLPSFAPSLNVPVGIIFFIFDSNYAPAVTSFSSGLYTLIVGIVYAVIAALLFKHRKSETATKSAPSAFLQSVYRFLVGFFFSSIVTFVLFMQLSSDTQFSVTPEEFGLYLLFYLLSVAAMLVFELISTRRWKGLFLRGIKTVGFLVVGNLLFFAVMYGVCQWMYTYSPEADEIDSVRILYDTDLYADVAYEGSGNYFFVKAGEIEIDDPTVRSIVARQLSASLRKLKESKYESYTYAGGNTTLCFSIKSGLIPRKRTIVLTEDDRSLLETALENNERYRKECTMLPESVAPYWYLDEKRSEEFYGILKQEVESLDFKTRYRLLISGEVDERIAVLPFEAQSGSSWYTMSIPLVPSLLPRTTTEYMRISNQCEPTEYLDALRRCETEAGYISVSVFENGVLADGYGMETPCLSELLGSTTKDERDSYREWVSALSESSLTDFDLDGIIYLVNLDLYPKEDGIYTSYYFYLQEPSGQIPAWMTAHGLSSKY